MRNKELGKFSTLECKNILNLKESENVCVCLYFFLNQNPVEKRVTNGDHFELLVAECGRDYTEDTKCVNYKVWSQKQLMKTIIFKNIPISTYLDTEYIVETATCLEISMTRKTLLRNFIGESVVVHRYLIILILCLCCMV